MKNYKLFATLFVCSICVVGLKSSGNTCVIPNLSESDSSELHKRIRMSESSKHDKGFTYSVEELFKIAKNMRSGQNLLAAIMPKRSLESVKAE